MRNVDAYVVSLAGKGAVSDITHCILYAKHHVGTLNTTLAKQDKQFFQELLCTVHSWIVTMSVIGITDLSGTALQCTTSI